MRAPPTRSSDSIAACIPSETRTADRARGVRVSISLLQVCVRARCCSDGFPVIREAAVVNYVPAVLSEPSRTFGSPELAVLHFEALAAPDDGVSGKARHPGAHRDHVAKRKEPQIRQHMVIAKNVRCYRHGQC